MFFQALRWIGGVGMIPVSIGFSISFYEHLLAIRKVGEPEVALLLGITAYLAFHVLIGPPSRAYVLGHELTHATAVWMSGGEVKKIQVGSKKGSVLAGQRTGLIALAPYLLPVYAILWAFLYGAASLFWNVRGWVYGFLFGLGAALAFHLVFTVEALKRKQPDLEVLGPLISLGLIYCSNLSLIVAVMALIMPEVRFGSYLLTGFRETGGLYQRIFTQLFG